MSRARPKSPVAVACRRGVSWLLAAASFAAGSASAADFSVGIAAGSDNGRVDCVASFPCDRSSTYWKLSASYLINDAVDVQALYLDGGRFQGGDITPLGTEFGGTFKVEALGVTGGYRWQFAPQWSLVGRAGFASVRTRFEYANTVWGSVSETTFQPLAGLGVGYQVTPALRIGLDYDVTRFKVYRTHGSLQMLGVAGQFSF